MTSDMSQQPNLLPEGEYQGRVDKAEIDTLRDGSQVLALEFVVTDANGAEHRIYDVIQSQPHLDAFLSSIGLPPGSMILNGPP